MQARRCQCAFPGCPQGDVVFTMLKEGHAHLEESHGIRLPWPRKEDGLVLLDPPRPNWGRRGSARDFSPTPMEYHRLLEAARDEVDRVIFLTLGESGLRSGELRHLRPSWLRDGVLHVPYRDPVTGWEAKTKQAARAIPLREMSGKTWDVLEDWCARPVRRARWGSALPLGISSFALWERVRNGGRRASLPRRLFPHALRSYCATVWAYNLGGNPFVLMDLMGWSSVKVAMAYVRSTGRGLEDAVEAWNRSANNGGHNGGSMLSPGSPRDT